MARLIVYYAHPGHRHSIANRPLVERARAMRDITFVDLYGDYPRFDIDIAAEQRRLLDHDVVVLQFPMFWYSSPALVKEWLDLVLEHGWAYGEGGEALRGKRLMLAITASAPADAYCSEGYQRFPIRSYLQPFERTAGLCHMSFPAPYVLFDSRIAAGEERVMQHADGYQELLEAIRDDRFDFAAAAALDILTADTLPIKGRG